MRSNTAAPSESVAVWQGLAGCVVWRWQNVRKRCAAAGGDGGDNGTIDRLHDKLATAAARLETIRGKERRAMLRMLRTPTPFLLSSLDSHQQRLA